MDFRILGPLEVSEGERTIELGGDKQRALLAILLLHANEVVSADRLIDLLWEERPPPSALKRLHAHVSRLRRALETNLTPSGASSNGVILTRGHGYLVQVEPGELDVDRFRGLIEEGRESLAAGEPEKAAGTLRAGLALWRGPPLADFTYDAFAQPAIAQFEELHLRALEERIDADLALGRHRELVAELAALVERNPLRERMRMQLMLALYRCGRQAEALEVHQHYRRALAEELGLDPSPALRQLEAAILNRDPSLELAGAGGRRAEAMPGRPGLPAARPPRRLSLAIIGPALIAIAVAAAVVASMRGEAARVSMLTADAVGAIDPATDAIGSVVPVGSSPSRLVAGDGTLWVTNYNDQTVSRIDLSTNTVRQTIAVGSGPSGIAVGAGTVWVANRYSGTVSRIDARSGQVVQTIGVGNAPSATALHGGSLWITSSTDATVTRLDAVTGAVSKTIALGGGATDVAAGPDGVWVTDEPAGRVFRIDPQTNQVAQAINVGSGPGAIALGAGSVWVANTLDGTVSRIDPQRSAVIATIAVGDGPNGIAFGAGAVWVTNEFAGTLSRIDPATNEVVRTIKLGNPPRGIAVAANRVWVGAQAPASSHRGGTLTVLNNAPFDSLDPAVGFSVPSIVTLGLTSDGLTAYRRVGGSEGQQLVPDLAVSLPTPTDGGVTYSFELRPGIRYSDGEPLRAEDFRRAIVRALAIGATQPSLYYTGIVGGAACIAHPARCDLSKGIVTDNAQRRVSFHLVAPDPEFLDKLAAWSAVAVPASVPAHAVDHPLPATGAYVVAGYSPGRRVTLVRNPYFHEWSRAARPDGYPDQIVWRLGASATAELTAVEQGSADYTFDGPPPQRVTEVQTRFASQLYTAPEGVTSYLAINTRVPPFTDLKVRQALNYAIDRREIGRLVGGAAPPTCQLLPPNLPGYRPYCPYTLQPDASGTWRAPDLAKAQRLIVASHTSGAQIAVWSQPGFQRDYAAAGRYVVSLLDRLGYRARLKLFAASDFSWFTFGDPRTRAHLAFIEWAGTYPSPSQYIGFLFSCGAFQPHAPINPNFSEFCDPHLDRQIQSALNAEGTNSPAAPQLWARADRRLTDQAPLVPLVNPTNLDLVSRRVGNYQVYPQYGLRLDQLWVR